MTQYALMGDEEDLPKQIHMAAPAELLAIDVSMAEISAASVQVLIRRLPAEFQEQLNAHFAEITNQVNGDQELGEAFTHDVLTMAFHLRVSGYSAGMFAPPPFQEAFKAIVAERTVGPVAEAGFNFNPSNHGVA